MSSKTQQDKLGKNVEESSFSVQTKATKAFKDIKAELCVIFHIASAKQPADLGAAFKSVGEFEALRGVVMGNFFAVLQARKKVASFGKVSSPLATAARDAYGL
jgi:hypothetical protein